MISSSIRIAGSALGLALAASLAAQQASFVPIPGTDTVPGSNASFCGISGTTGWAGVLVSGDGQTVATVTYAPGFVNGAVPRRAVRWRASTGTVAISPELLGNYGVTGLSRDGSVVFGESWRWREGRGYESLLPRLGNGFFQTRVLFGCTSDGTTAVGIEGIFPGPGDMFRWRVDGGTPVPVPRTNGYAEGYFYFNVISGDGNVLAGGAKRDTNAYPGAYVMAAVVVDGNGATVLTGESGQDAVADLSFDGSVAVGSTETAPGASGARAFRWQRSTGLVVLDSGFPNSSFSGARGVDATGDTIVGDYGTFGIPGTRPFLWTSAGGFVDLEDELINNYGMRAELFGWQLLTASDVSLDGRTIVGQGVNPAGCEQAFLVRLPRAPGAVRRYGPTCTGPAGELRLTAVEAPFVGIPHAVACEGTGATTVDFVLYGLAPLALPLASILPQGQAGCELLVTPDVARRVPTVGGRLIATLPIPNDPTLVGGVLRTQVVQLDVDRAGRPLAVRSSNALELTIGAL